MDESLLLEIKLEDTDSVPEVYYKREKIDLLVDFHYHWHTEGDSGIEPKGRNNINIEFYSGKEGKNLDMRTVRHQRINTHE